MKKSILTLFLIVFIMVSCNQKNKQAETTNTPLMENDSKMINDSHSKLYSCPMHPEVHGNLNDKCPKCGMKLTVEVK